jgi:glucose dehydrogenase
MRRQLWRAMPRVWLVCAAALPVVAAGCGTGDAQPWQRAPVNTGVENGEWRYLGGDVGHTRYTPLDQITPANLHTLVEAWNFGAPEVVGGMTARSTPSFVNGKLLSVAGARRHVVSIHPKTGQLLWNFVEPETFRSQYSMRAAYGKGVAYAEVEGRGEVVYISTPGFFLFALDANTGKPLENWAGESRWKTSRPPASSTCSRTLPAVGVPGSA